MLQLPESHKTGHIGLLSRFAKNLKHFRVANELSQRELANKMNVSQNFISELEHGKKSPSVEFLAILAYTLNIPASEFFT